MYAHVALKFQYLTSLTRNKYKFKQMIKMICCGEMSSSRHISIFDNFYFEDRPSRASKECPRFWNLSKSTVIGLVWMLLESSFNIL